MEVIAIILGLLIGSFLSVCIFRIPLSRTDLWEPEEEDRDLQGESDVSSVDSGSPEAAADALHGGKPVEPAQPESVDMQAIPTSTAPQTTLLRPGEVSLIYPVRSVCPHCEQQLLWWHNIPVMSWLVLRGRCGFCKAPISARYPLVELLSAGTAYLSVLEYGVTLTALIVYLFCCALIVISFIDYDFFIIPKSISQPGTWLGVVFAVINHYYHLAHHPVAESMTEALLGVITGGGVLWIIRQFYLKLRKVDALGLGDVKLLTMTGVWFGWECSFYTIFVGSLVGSVIGLAGIALRLRTMKQELPFGPFLALGTALYLFTDMKLIDFIAHSIISLVHPG